MPFAGPGCYRLEGVLRTEPLQCMEVSLFTSKPTDNPRFSGNPLRGSRRTLPRAALTLKAEA